MPYFCWHPAPGSVGASRQCAVKEFRDEYDQHDRLVMACMTAASDGLRICVGDSDAVAFRASVIEWLMVNHPHDRPVCEEGGECHLQDRTVKTGHVRRHDRFTKRTHRNQYLGPFLTHEMNRCIAGCRCARFYRDHAGGRDFDAQAAHPHVYGRHADGVLESDFSSNLAEVCPTGAWAPSLSSRCSLRPIASAMLTSWMSIAVSSGFGPTPAWPLPRPCSLSREFRSPLASSRNSMPWPPASTATMACCSAGGREHHRTPLLPAGHHGDGGPGARDACGPTHPQSGMSGEPLGHAVLAALVLLLMGLGALSRAASDAHPHDHFDGGALTLVSTAR
ncbi:MAG TPA: hypothetical protein VFX20_04500 [Steroidobacteraceae bacterium]|nr:hypothetical protein [Steroidobacteraceae bacterium]